MLNSFPQEALQNECHLIIQEVLGDSYIRVFIGDFSLVEDDKKKITHVNCKIFFSNNREETIEGKGHGIVDALFNSIIQKYSSEYTSLTQVRFDDFIMKVNFKSANSRSTDSPVEIKLALKTITRREQNIFFSATARSMVVAAISVIRKAFEYFINAEAAVLVLQESIKDARARNRRDLNNKYVSQMAQLVQIVSYEDVLL